MLEPTIFKAVGDYGVGVGLVIVLCIISYAIIKHILKQGDSLMKMAMEQNSQWQKVIDEHTAQAKEFHNTSNEAHRYQREEHMRLMEKAEASTQLLIKHKEEVASAREILDKNVEQRTREHERIMKGLDEICLNLVRINGYKR